MTLSEQSIADMRDFAERLNVIGKDFEKASALAVKTTVRTLARISSKQLRAAIGAEAGGVKNRVKTRFANGGARLWFGIDKISAARLKAAQGKAQPGSFQLRGKKPWFSRKTPGANWDAYSAGFTGSRSGRKADPGILKLYKFIDTEGKAAAGAAIEMAETLLRKNLEREIDRVLRARAFAK